MKISGLDTTDRELIAALDVDCQVSNTELADLLGVTRQTVANRLRQLGEEGVLTGFHTSINPHRMGRRIFKLYLKLRNIPQEKCVLLERLRSKPNVYWMGECSGSWDVICALYCENDFEFFQEKNSLLSEFTNIIVAESGGLLIDVLQFPKMWLTEDLHPPVTFAGKVVPNSLDLLDLGILRELVADARTPAKKIAESLKSTTPTVLSRIEKLEQAQVIIQYRVGVDLEKLGLQLYKAVMRFEQFSEEKEKAFRDYACQIPQLQYFIRDMWQYELEFVVTDFNHYSEIIDGIKREFPYLLRSIDTVLMLTDEWLPGAENLLVAD